MIPAPVRDLLELRHLPRRVALFYGRARWLARVNGHEWALEAATPAMGLARLLEIARGRERVAELGTGPAWTAIALALDDPRRRVVTFDPVVHANRRAYLRLAPADARARITFVQESGQAAAATADPVDMLFIDSTHEREATLAEFRAWRERLRPEAVVVFHDYRHPSYPGVAEAVEELGLEGQVRGGMFVWRAPATGPS